MVRTPWEQSKSFLDIGTAYVLKAFILLKNINLKIFRLTSYTIGQYISLLLK